MDGFEQNSGIIVIAATNFPQTLDHALTRPGRFDKHVAVPLPDVRGREKILGLYTSRTILDAKANLKALAQGTPGFSGADLSNLVNQVGWGGGEGGGRKNAMRRRILWWCVVCEFDVDLGMVVWVCFWLLFWGWSLLVALLLVSMGCVELIYRYRVPQRSRAGCSPVGHVVCEVSTSVGCATGAVEYSRRVVSTCCCYPVIVVCPATSYSIECVSSYSALRA